MSPELAKVQEKIAYYEANFASWDGDTTTHGAAMRVELTDKLAALRVKEALHERFA
jgi:hypothetical protein